MPRPIPLILTLQLLLATPVMAQGHLPTPSGPHPVGVARGAVTLNDVRVGIVAWYPAAASRGAVAALVPSAAVREAMASGEGWLGHATAEVRSALAVRPHARVDAPVATTLAPVAVLLAPGMGMPVEQYTALAEELASRGRLVVGLNPPVGGLAEIDGRLRTLADDPDFEDTPAWGAAAEARWGGHLVAAAGALAQGRLALGPIALPAVHRVVLVGHSLGGAAALAGCTAPALVIGCVNLDGATFGPVNEAGVAAPALVVKSVPEYSDEDLAERGRTREEWESRGAGLFELLTAPIRNGQRDGLWVEVRATGHLSFSDAPFLFPNALTQFGGRYLTPARTHALTVALVEGFVEAVAEGGDVGTLAGRLAGEPELTARVVTAEGVGR